MNRRKKSALFSASLAATGLIVAGSLFAHSNDTTAADFYGMSIDEVANVLSRTAKMPAANVKEALSTNALLVETNNYSNLEGLNASIKQTFGNTYILKFENDVDTAVAYKTLKSKGVNVLLDEVVFDADKTDEATIKDEYTAWGVESTNMDKYTEALSTCTNPVKVAVMDTGIRATHEVFENGSRLDMEQGHDYVNDDDDPADDHSHGTMVSGAIVESTPSCVKVVPIKILPGSGAGSLTPLYNALFDIANDVIDVDIINMSLGSEREGDDAISEEAMNWFDNAFAAVHAKGKILIAAAGNESHSVDYPASSEYVWAISSVKNDKLFSSAFSNFGQEVDFAAPGECLVLPYYLGDDYYSTCASGTSFSSPFAAAAVANIKAENRSWTETQIYNNLKLNSEDLGTPGKDDYYGHGSIAFHMYRFADIALSATESATYKNPVPVSYTITSTNYNIDGYTIVEGVSTEAPTSYTPVTAAKSVSGTYEATKNGTYTIWAHNSNGEIKNATFNVTKLDKEAPTISALTASTPEDNKAVLSITSTDLSGLSKIVWSYKKASAEDWTEETKIYNETAATAITKTLAIEGEPGVLYVAKAIVYDGAGNFSAAAQISFTITGDTGEEPEPDPTDVEAPEVTSLTGNTATKGKATLSLTVTDESGVKKVEWYYKLVSAAEYTSATKTYNNPSTDPINLEYEIAASAGDYQAYAVVYDGAGNTSTTEVIYFTIEAVEPEAPTPEEPGVPTPEEPVVPGDPIDNPKTSDMPILTIVIITSALALAAGTVVARNRKARR